MWKMGWICGIPLAVVVSACQKSDEPFQGQPPDQGYEQPEQQPDQPYQAPGYGEGTNGAAGTDQVGATDLPAPIRDLKQNIEKMRMAADMQHTDLVQALRSLANAYGALPMAGTPLTDAVSRIQSYADRIEASGATSNMHSRWAKRALKEGIDALNAYQKEQGYAGMEERMTMMTEQLDQISDDKPFMQQKEAFTNSFGQIADVLTEMSRPQQRGTE